MSRDHVTGGAKLQMAPGVLADVAELAGGSPLAARARSVMARVSAIVDPVLISAEEGLDAIQVARAIHLAGPRSAGPVVVVDCAGADAAELGRQMFGCDALGGSLLLQQVEELPTPLQTRLARALRDGQIDTDASGRGVAFDVRVLATTADHLEADLKDGKLRRELYVRFTQRLELPPLRHRPSDIPTLVGCLVAESAAASRVPVPAFSREALTLLSALPWRRNLAELREVLDVLVLGAVGGTVQLEDVLGHVPVERMSSGYATAVSLREARISFERQFIASVLHRHRGRMEDAARSLGIQRTNLYRKVRQLGLARAKG
ncbi:MAG: sigma 54-interacting transcriptional regulator [Vicinamibacterales bacterium]|nr:sigma 54-interacting transcriptional regulator [Vicinamibacterales bacterium]